MYFNVPPTLTSNLSVNEPVAVKSVFFVKSPVPEIKLGKKAFSSSVMPVPKVFSVVAGVDVLGVLDPLPLFEGGKAVETPPQAASPKTQAKADNDKNNFFEFFI